MRFPRRPSLMMHRLWNEVIFVETIAGGRWFLFWGRCAPKPPDFSDLEGFLSGGGYWGLRPQTPGRGAAYRRRPPPLPGLEGGYPLHPLLISQGQSFPPCLASFGRWVCALLTTVALAHVALCILIFEIAVRAPLGGSGGKSFGEGSHRAAKCRPRS